MIRARKRRWIMNTTSFLSSGEEAIIKYVCGIDVGSQSCSGCICRPNKQMVVKPVTFANSREGWHVLLERLRQLEVSPEQIVIGMEATARYHENLSYELDQRGYQLRLLHAFNKRIISTSNRACEPRPTGSMR
jgi:hypothetical protein